MDMIVERKLFQSLSILQKKQEPNIGVAPACVQRCLEQIGSSPASRIIAFRSIIINQFFLDLI